MIVIVGGHSRNIGKTTVAASLIAATPEARWTAVKITQHGHSFCGHGAHQCACAQHEGVVAVDEQTVPDGTDSGRLLGAGAARAYFLRTEQGQLAAAMPAIREIIGASANVLFESNSLMHFLRPDLYLVVVDFSVEDMKDSTRLFVNHADAFVRTGGETPRWPGVSPRWFTRKPILEPGSPELIALVKRGLAQPVR